MVLFYLILYKRTGLGLVHMSQESAQDRQNLLKIMGFELNLTQIWGIRALFLLHLYEAFKFLFGISSVLGRDRELLL